MGISLWLVPTPSESHHLLRLLTHRPLPTPPTSPASYPPFHPHITLASLPPTTDPTTLRAALPAHPALPVRFAALCAADAYFRAVYAAVVLSAELAALHAAVHAALGAEARTPAFPHMSVYYVADADAAQRAEAVRALEARGVVRPHPDEDGVLLDCACIESASAVETGAVMAGFTASEIWIVRCEGPVEGWEVLDKIALATSELQPSRTERMLGL